MVITEMRVKPAPSMHIPTSNSVVTEPVMSTKSALSVHIPTVIMEPELDKIPAPKKHIPTSSSETALGSKAVYKMNSPMSNTVITEHVLGTKVPYKGYIPTSNTVITEHVLGTKVPYRGHIPTSNTVITEPVLGTKVHYKGHVPTPSTVITEPVLGTKPAYRGHVLESLNVKPLHFSDRENPAVLSSVDIADIHAKPSVPYRLPRISPRITPGATSTDDQRPEDDALKMWGRFGYEQVIRIPALTPHVNKVAIQNNARLPQPLQSGTLPHFPTSSVLPNKPFYRARNDYSMYTSLVEKTQHGRHVDGVGPNGPTPTPSVSRLPSASMSVKSIHWKLGNKFKNQVSFDKSGRGRVQGPFSREFTVTCYAPQNWLRLKLGRSKTMSH